MYIEFKNKKLRKLCETQKEAQKKWGPRNAAKLIQRLNEMKAAESLADLFKLPATGCHSLTNNRDGEFAVYLIHPFRLVFEPSGNPEDYMDGTEVNLKKVIRVRILEVVNYHE